MKIKFASLFLTAFFVSCSINSANAKFAITSVDIAANSTITQKHVFKGFGCTGENISPQISWSNPPLGTKSFALTVYDPDAPTGSGWWHYLAINIPANYSEFKSGFAAENKFITKDGINQIRNDFGVHNFGGPCPPKGDKVHRYIFTIFALKVEKLDVSESSSPALAGYMINQNVLAKASFAATYRR
ncbi:MAG: YbhB/YbcL family Raf kinase inhibitor-like protein [Rickettsiales bacterium]|nr:YbhB/YbcL family Raf kinase inhibitor-like protein [Rickettsiales bacterium]